MRSLQRLYIEGSVHAVYGTCSYVLPNTLQCVLCQAAYLQSDYSIQFANVVLKHLHRGQKFALWTK